MFEQLLGQLLTGGIGNAGRRRSHSGFGLSRTTKSQIGVGAIGLAIAAWEHFKSKPAAGTGGQAHSLPASPAPYLPPPPPPAARSLEAPVATDNREADAAHLIRSMIAAANADGQIDTEERTRILERALEAGLDPTAQKFLMGELRAPATLEQIVAVTRPELRMETYAAALIAISIDSDAERSYLARLAQTLGLDAAEVERVQQQVGVGQS